MVHHPLIRLNSSCTSLSPATFNAIYCGEILLMISCLIQMPVSVMAVLRARTFHRNCRLLIASLGIYFALATIARGELLYYQMYRLTLIEDNPTDTILTYAQIIRFAFMGYMCLFVASIGIERLVAIFWWKWYEKQSQSTLLIFCALQLMLIYPSMWIACNHIKGVYNLEYCLVCFSAMTTISVLLIIFTAFANRRALKTVNFSTSVLHVYSLSKTFQLKENDRLLSLLKRMFLPTSVIDGICIAVHASSTILPDNYHLTRCVLIAFHDFWIALFGNVIIALIISRDASFLAEIWKMPIFRSIYKSTQMGKISHNQTNDMGETEDHFNHMSAIWNSAHRSRSII